LYNFGHIPREIRANSVSSIFVRANCFGQRLSGIFPARIFHRRGAFRRWEFGPIENHLIFSSGTPILQDVFIAQKRLVRALAGERYWPADVPLCSARPLFERLQLLPSFSIYLLEACKFFRQYPHYFFFYSLSHTLGRARDASSLAAETLGQL
jgi:hypothetical protein